MIKQKTIDFQVIDENGIKFGYNDLMRLSQNASSWIEAFSASIQKYDNSENAKKNLHFWMNVAYAKNYIMLKNFCDGDFKDRIYGMADMNGIWYVTYDYNNDVYYGSSVPEVIIYLAFMVLRDKIDIEQAIEQMDRYVLWRKSY